MGKAKIVIDTNNYISALGWEGKSRELMRKVIDKEFDLFISVQQLVELRRVLNYEKFDFSEEQKKKFMEIIMSMATLNDPPFQLSIAKDADDNRLLECAIEARADYLISGDMHLKSIKKFKKIRILSVSAFLEEMEKK
jgi:putative PIN family toxin of toxin-antitoxin system